ncbi:DUF7940 domain-containing protein [Massilia antarctica]|uniref:DUF7940 domain-containing protein n=1 Tax=Massilia antarctica TaxID=2765360 RepID=UPI0006BB67C9|nr:hypothetical protein [Massilia sp. H27-R4]MCY0911134.1 hypothetical protein [Massilia sp. H27-R4]CUI05282.1 hypothetical protein BN2497_5341 [Janthinobacterium sp. CG23_2]CUU29068.1 hypothetical protein BN3177_5341 [Janthinobacterium sp. CG23_2]
MILVANWRAVLAKAWSLKFTAAAGLLGAAEVYIAIAQPAGVPNGVFAGIGALVSVLAFVARLMAQEELRDGHH